MSKASRLIKRQQEEKRKEVDVMVEKCTPVIHGIFAMIAELKPNPDTQTQEEFIESYSAPVVASLELMKETNLTIEECSWVLERVSNIAETIKRRAVLALEKSLNLAEEKVFGKPTEQLTLNEIDEIIKDVDKT